MITEKLDVKKRTKRFDIRSLRLPDKRISNLRILNYKVREFQIKKILGRKARNLRLQNRSSGGQRNQI